MRALESDAVKQKVMSYGFNERNYMAVVTEGLRQADVLGITKDRRAIEFEIKVSRADLQKELAAIRYVELDTVKKQLHHTDGTPQQLALSAELGKLHKKSGGWSKISKHEEYIDPVAYFEKMNKRWYYHRTYIPNTYYFVVPKALTDLAIEGTKGTPYGVIAYDGCRQRDQHVGYFHSGIWYDRDADLPEGARWTSGRPCSASTCYEEIAVYKKAGKIHDEPISDLIINEVLQRAVRENINMLGELVGLSGLVKKQREEIKALKEAQS